MVEGAGEFVRWAWREDYVMGLRGCEVDSFREKADVFS